MHSTPDPSCQAPADVAALSAQQLAELVGKQEREIVNLRRQVAWFQRQVFGQKSEKRQPEPEGVQGTLGVGFDAVPGTPLPGKKTVVAGHERKPKQPCNGADESTLFFDEKKVPVEVIAVPNSDAEGLAPDRYEVIGEKVTYRLAAASRKLCRAQVRAPVIKRHDTQVLSCPPAV